MKSTGEHRHIRTSIKTDAYQVGWLWRKNSNQVFSCLYLKLHAVCIPILSLTFQGLDNFLSGQELFQSWSKFKISCLNANFIRIRSHFHQVWNVFYQFMRLDLIRNQDTDTDLLQYMLTGFRSGFWMVHWNPLQDALHFDTYLFPYIYKYRIDVKVAFRLPIFFYFAPQSPDLIVTSPDTSPEASLFPFMDKFK